MYCLEGLWEKRAVESRQPDACRIISPSLEWPRDWDQPPRAKVTAIPRTKSKVPLESGSGDLKALQGNPKAALPSLCPPVSFGFLGCMHALANDDYFSAGNFAPWEFGKSLAPERFVSQPFCFLAWGLQGSGWMCSGTAAPLAGVKPSCSSRELLCCACLSRHHLPVCSCSALPA